MPAPGKEAGLDDDFRRGASFDECAKRSSGEDSPVDHVMRDAPPAPHPEALAHAARLARASVELLEEAS